MKEQLIPPVALLATAGLIAGLGQLLASNETLTKRIVIGRALSSLALGTSAGVFLAWMPDLPIEALMGAAALIASLGTSALESILQKILGKDQ